MNVPSTAALPVLAVMVMIVGMYTALKSFERRSQRDTSADAAWAAAEAGETSPIGRVLLKVSRPLVHIPQIYEADHSPMYRALYNRILASGTYGGSLEVFLAVQGTCVFLGLLFIIGALTSGLSGLLLLVWAVIGLGVTAFPYNIVMKKANDRINAVEQELPDFAELLLMPLESGMSPLAALAFTAERLHGPVAQEVRNLRTVISSRTMAEAEAFQLAAARLGTAEASAFFTALMQAHLEGARVVANLQAQAEALRMSLHQKRRSEMKKLPQKVVFVMALHLLPLLFVAALLPTFFALTQI